MKFSASPQRYIQFTTHVSVTLDVQAFPTWPICFSAFADRNQLLTFKSLERFPSFKSIKLWKMILMSSDFITDWQIRQSTDSFSETHWKSLSTMIISKMKCVLNTTLQSGGRTSFKFKAENYWLFWSMTCDTISFLIDRTLACLSWFCFCLLNSNHLKTAKNTCQNKFFKKIIRLSVNCKPMIQIDVISAASPINATNILIA